MTGLPRDPTERHKLTLLADLHRQLLSYRDAERGQYIAGTNSDVTISEELTTCYPDLPCQATLGKTLAETIIEEWLQPRVRQTLEKFDPRRIKTPTQAHRLQGVLAYYFTYVQEHLSAGQLVDTKLHDAQSICDTWCQITGTKRFVVNKSMENLLAVKSPRTVQRYVAQGMATIFGIAFGSARPGKKATASPRTESNKEDAHASDVADPIPDQAGPSPGRLSQMDAAKSSAESMSSSLDGSKLDQYLSTIADVHKGVTSVATFTALAQFALQVSEAVYSHSRRFGSFVHDLSQYQPDALEDRLDIAELRELLRNHPVVKQVLDEKHTRRLHSTRDSELLVIRQLCDNLTHREHRAHREVQAWITQVCAIVVGRPEDADFMTPLTQIFDRLPASDQVVLVARLLEDCRPHAFGLAVALAARPSGAFVRSRVRYLVRTSRGCPEHLNHAREQLAQRLECLTKGSMVSLELRHEMFFLERYLKAGGISINPPMEMAFRELVGGTAA